MARMIPANARHEDFNDSLGEEQIYAALQSLPDEYIVLHSVSWRKKERNRVLQGEADFTIFHPQRGILVLEVKSGGIAFQDGRWKQTNTLTGVTMDMKDPLAQADRSKFAFIDELPLSLYRIEAAVWFTSINACPADLPSHYKPELILLKRDLKTPLQSIENVFNYFGMREQSRYTPEDTDTVLRLLAPCFGVIPSLSDTIGEQDILFNRMTQEQSGLLDYLEEQRTAAIRGGAGTGKTLLAVEKAKRLAQTGKVLFLCFNNLLCDFLKRNCAAQAANIDFYNIHGLTCSKANLREATAENIADFLLSYESYGWDYRHIVIDEGQDLRPEHISLLAEIAKKQDGSFYVFYDRNQLVQQSEGLQWLEDMECQLVLNINCRNTKSIAETSYRPIGIAEVRMKENMQGNTPCLCIADTTEQARARIAERIRYYTDQGIAKKDIVIITVKTKEDSVLSNQASVCGYPLANEPDAPGVFFTTSRKFKGLESPVVLVVDLDASTFSSEKKRRVFYVGASRAKNCLDSIAVLDNTQLASIAEQLT
ncbi:MAG: NERD domain-containing protein, partial [Oscillospiraceae bacterium]|nr:NERD domain-containing protein [Oscillospiraceae bacterium]